MHLVRSDGELYKVRNSEHNLQKNFPSRLQTPSNRATVLKQTVNELVTRYKKAKHESWFANENCMLKID